MRLKRLIDALDKPEVISFEDFTVKGIACNSREARKDYIFIAIKGTHLDGHKFIKGAIKNGAKAIVSQSGPEGSISKGLTWITVKDARSALARLAAEFYGQPSSKMKVVGITGTNGKTSVSYLIESLLKLRGEESAVIGTINYRFKDKLLPAKNTTPGPLEIQSLLDQIQRQDISYVVIEVSSHALDQERVGGIHFSYAIFTNLTQDHLDYHHNMKEYFQAKARLFGNLKPEALSIINIDDPYGKKLTKLTQSRIITYGLNEESDIFAYDIRSDIAGTKFILSSPRGRIDFDTELIGIHNVYNILAAVSFGISAGFELESIKEAIKKFKPPAGRLERIDVHLDCFVFVDYAHSPDALKNVILALRKVYNKRILVTFGCGGNRDREKRPKMGEVVTELADFAMITSDNPRDEEPMDIIKDILKGIKKDNYKIEPDRKNAIFESLRMAKSGDVILIAGKGHEDYQILKHKIIPFNDREVVRRFCNSPPSPPKR